MIGAFAKFALGGGQQELGLVVAEGCLGALQVGIELVARNLCQVILEDARGFAYRLALWVCLRAPTPETGRVPVNATNPLTMESYQFKGDVIEIAEPDEAARHVADQRVAQFTEAITRVGFVQGSAAGVAHPGPARRIVLQVREIFDQTPGPGAGRRLGAR